MATAVATPAMFPVPTTAAIDVRPAFAEEIEPSPSDFAKALPIVFFTINLVFDYCKEKNKKEA